MLQILQVLYLALVFLLLRGLVVLVVVPHLGLDLDPLARAIINSVILIQVPGEFFLLRRLLPAVLDGDGQEEGGQGDDGQTHREADGQGQDGLAVQGWGTWV